MSTTMFLSADVGGTKTLLGLFEPASGNQPRVRRVAARSFRTLDYADLTAMITVVLSDAGVKSTTITSACFGIAGPVLGEIAEVTNIPWKVDSRSVAAAFGIARVRLINDLQAIAYSVPVLAGDEVLVLQEGRPPVPGEPPGNIAIIAAGTGLGEALLHSHDGRWIALPSEGGHADFAARNEREFALVQDLTRRFGRADVERVVSGRGLPFIHRVCHPTPCGIVIDLEDPEAPALITAAALERQCPQCVDTLELFVEAYGAEAGNHALRTVATGGVFIGGGIAPKIIPAMTNGTFMRAFLAKPPLGAMLHAMPVKIILNQEAGVLGAAMFASQM